MKRILALSTLALSSIAFGQQSFHSSQYTQNMYLLNPAAAGLSNNIDVNLGHRSQWTNFDNAPSTYYLSANALLGKPQTNENIFSLRISEPTITTGNNKVAASTDGKVKHAIGGVFFSDKAGAFNRTSGAASYTIHIPVGKKSSLAAGVRLGVNNTAFDRELAGVRDQNDQFFTDFANGNASVSKLDGSIGLMYYTPKFYLGYALDQMFGNTLDFSDDAEAQLVSHHLINAGLRLQLNENIGVTPSTMVRLTAGAPPSYDINAKIDYKNNFFVGVGVRPSDAIILQAGIRVNENIKFGYSYDLTTSDVSTVSGGTHEVVLGIAISK
jgi:type IX secretion system PorP/SprF family membrane protein